MPIPLILGLAAGAAAITGIGAGAKGAMDLSDANETKKLAQSIYEKSKRKTENLHTETVKKLDNMGIEQIKIQETFKKFSDLYEQIQNRPTMEEIVLDGKKIEKINLDELREVSLGATAVLGAVGGMAAGTIGGLAASGATTAAVMSFGAASTGTAIASLSGAAATNATLAFLGGGSLAAGGGGMALGTAVLGGVTLGMGLLAAGAIVCFTGAKNLEEANKLYREAFKVRYDNNKICERLEEIKDVVKKYMDSFEKLKTIYLKNLDKLEDILETGVTDYNEFRPAERTSLKVLVDSVTILRDALKIKLLDDIKDMKLNPKVENEIENIERLTEEKLS